MNTLNKLVLANTSGNSIKLILEPWAEEYEIENGMKIEIHASDPNDSSIEIEYEKENIIVYGWADSMTVLCEGKKLEPDFD